MRTSDLLDESLVVWGAGREARSFADALQRRGYSNFCLAVDHELTKPEAGRHEGAGNAYPIVDGAAGRERILGARQVVASPSIPPANALRTELSRREGRFTTTFDLWMNEFGSRTIGITGSKGKSTTSAIVKALLDSANVDAALGGNIGVPVWDLPESASWFVVETSSFQAYGMTCSPKIGIVTALFPEHLDWHGDWDSYRLSKWNLLAHGTELAVVSRNAAACLPPWPPSTDLKVVFESDDWPTTLKAGLTDAWSTSSGPWRYEHNRLNAVLATYAVGRAVPTLQSSQVVSTLGSFGGLPHRLEIVHDEGGVQWIDDSLATSPAPTIAALEALGDVPVTLISGGKDRGLNYQEFLDYLAQRGSSTIFVGISGTGHELADSLSGSVECHRVDSMQAAVRIAADRTPSPGVVLFSPSAATPEGEGNFESRSHEFRHAIANQSTYFRERG